MPIYSNIKTQEVKDKLQALNYKLYRGGQIFYSGCLIDVPEEFKAGSKIFPAGIYKVRTIKSNGSINLENSNGEEISTSASYLVAADFKKKI